MTRGRAIVLAVVCAAVLVAAWVLREPDSPSTAAGVGHEDAAGPAASGPVLLGAPGEAATTPSAPPAADDDASPPATAPPPTVASYESTWLVQATITGFSSADDITQAKVLLSGEEDAEGDEFKPTEHEVSIAPNGTFVIPVAHVRPQDRIVSVHIDHEGFMPAAVALSEDAFAPAGDDPGRNRVASISIPLTPAYRLMGRVLRPDGTSRATADVAVFRKGRDATPVDEVEASSKGYQLRVPVPGPYVVVAAETNVQAALASVEVHERETKVPPLMLLPEAKIVGRATVGGRVPLARVSFWAYAPQGAGTRARVGYRDLRLDSTAGTVRNTAEYGTTDDQGNFEIHHLNAGPYRLDFWRDGGPDVLGPEPDLRVQAPDENVRADFPGAILRVVPKAGDGWATGADVSIHVGDLRGKLEVEPHRPPAWIVPAHESVTVRVQYFGKTWEQTVGDLQAGDDHTETVLVDPPKRSATLRVELRGEQADAVTLLGLYGMPDEGDTVLAKASWGDGTFSFPGLRAATYELEFTPGREYFATSGYWLQQGLRGVVLHPGAESTLQVPLVEGGRIRVEALAKDGTRLSCRCLVFDAQGKDMDVWFDDGPQRDHLRALRPSVTHEPLPPGAYVAKAWIPGGDPVEQRFRVSAGKTTLVTLGR